MKIFIAILFSLFVFALGMKAPISYNAKANQKHLDIHIIAHTHDDVGWLKTVDEYYIGAKQSIQNAGVQYILDTVVKELATDPKKKFSYVEMAYFYRYWNECTEDEKNQIRQLVKNGQLEFVNGGWCMNDEANTHLEGNTEQMTRGHEFLVQEVGVDPSLITTGWQLDPFGHSSEYAVLNTKIGFNSLFFARVDFQDYQNRKQNKQLEFVWRPSVSAGKNTEIFTHILWDTTYCYPSDFAFEWGDTPVQDDPRLFNENVEQRANQFAALMREREQYYVTDQIFVTYGCDFNYQNFMNYRNMDKLIKYINNNPSVYNMTLFYSTPSIYTKAIYQKNLTWTVKTDDFFPYRDNMFSCWSGYFTSRPALKAYVRTRENLLYSTYKLVSSSRSNVSLYLDAVDVGRRAVGVAQHHDAIAGTEKQAVAYDYAERLSIGTQSLYTVWDGVLNDLMKIQQNSNSLSFSFCDHLNISVCPNTQQIGVGTVLPLVLYNAIGFTRTEYVRLPVPTQSISVLDANGSPVATQFVINDDKTSPYILIFSATLPPMGFSTFFIQRTSNPFSGNYKPSVGQPYILENENLRVQFSENSGKLNYITNKKSGVSIYVEEDIQWYVPSVGDQLSSQASGAYIFRPDLKSTITINQTPSLVQINGPVVSEIRQYYADWAYQTIRLYTDANFLEFETTIGPIPINDGYGKEVITRFKTNISSNNEWWTDSEGAELMYRKKNYRQTWNFTYVVPVTGNYVPVNEVALIKDQSACLSVVVDRSRGGCSDEVGELEFMNHRRLLVDDGRGVGEPLNETEAIRTTTNVIVETPALSSQLFRKRSLYLTHPVVYAFANPVSSFSQFRSTYKTSYQGLTADLPPNVHLQTFRAYGNGRYLFRLRHLFGVGEDQNLSKPVVIDVSSLFAGRTLVSMQETQLTGILDINQVDRYQWQTVNQAKTFFPQPKDNAFTVTLNPLDLRTWLIQLQ